jgi:hypothetical protein
MTSRWILALFTFLATIPVAYSKSSPDLILVSGDGLTAPIEITGLSSLKAFDPWNGQFADWKQKPLTDAPCFRRSMEVLFYKKWGERKSSLDHGDLQLIYATCYCSSNQGGYVYLPGRSDAHYRENMGTIIRDDADGKWYPATPAWDSLLSNAVATREQQATTDMIVLSGGELQRPVEITDPELLNVLDPWSGLFVGWNQPAAMGHCSWEYEVTYFKRGLKTNTPYDRGDLKMIYGLRYCLGDDGEPGYVHLAGPTHKFWPENVPMVWDGTQAGKWHPSTAAWKAWIRQEVVEQEDQAKDAASSLHLEKASAP